MNRTLIRRDLLRAIRYRQEETESRAQRGLPKLTPEACGYWQLIKQLSGLLN